VSGLDFSTNEEDVNWKRGEKTPKKQSSRPPVLPLVAEKVYTGNVQERGSDRTLRVQVKGDLWLRARRKGHKTAERGSEETGQILDVQMSRSRKVIPRVQGGTYETETERLSREEVADGRRASKGRGRWRGSSAPPRVYAERVAYKKARQIESSKTKKRKVR